MASTPIPPEQPAADSGHDIASGLHTSTGFRVFQACNVCRRRKSKCNGVRPRCGGCILRQLHCSWPSNHPSLPAPSNDVSTSQTSGVPSLDREELHKSRSQLRSGRVRGSSHPPAHLIQRALDLFYARHHSTEFCSFLHVPSLDVEVLRRGSPLFTHALLALSALYMSKEEAHKEGFETVEALSEWHTIAARDHSRQTVDAPSIRSIQGNLILALRELVTRTAYKAWIFTGIAIRQAQTLRLGREYHSRLSKRHKEVQRRTYWACFVMDRIVSYCCWRPQMIDVDCVSLNLPCPENLFTFEEPYDGPGLHNQILPCDVSRLGMAPYWITMVDLWAQATYIQIKGGFRHVSHDATDPRCARELLQAKIHDFHRSLSPTMEWSTRNRMVLRHMNQEQLFIAFHLLLNHARCAIHEESLPYDAATVTTLDQIGLMTSNYDSEALRDGHQASSVAVCIDSSEEIVKIATEALHPDGHAQPRLPSIFAASAILSAVNVQLWLQHVYLKDDEQRRLAASKVETMAAVLGLWKSLWTLADSWSSTITSLRRLYKATYCPDVDLDNDHEERPAQKAHTDLIQPDDSNSYERPSPCLIEGNGLPVLKENMADKVRFILLASLEDTDARERVLSSSMNTIEQPGEHYDGLFENFQYGLHEHDIDDIWSGFIGDPD